MFDAAPKARDQTFILTTAHRGVAGEFVELDMLRPHDATDQQGQGVEVLFVMAAGAGMQRLRQRAFDGTIGLEGNVHGKLLSSDVVIEDGRIPCTLASDCRTAMPDHTVSSYFLYGSEFILFMCECLRKGPLDAS